MPRRSTNKIFCLTCLSVGLVVLLLVNSGLELGSFGGPLATTDWASWYGNKPSPLLTAPEVMAADPQELFGCKAKVRQARYERCASFAADAPRPRVLVTGGAGFIGGHLVKGLLQSGIRSVKVVDNLWRGRLSNLCDYSCNCVIDLSADFCMVDLSDRNALGGLFDNVDKVYHLADVIAGIGFVFQNEHWIYQQNGIINSNVLNAVLASPSVHQYVYVGSACSFPLELQSGYEPIALHEDQTYPAHPESAYGWSKLMGEYEASLALKMDSKKRHDLNVATLRFHNVYGPHSQYIDKQAAQALPALIRKAVDASAGGNLEIWGSGKQNRDFIYVDDIVRALLLVDRGMGRGAIQIGTGVATTLLKAAQDIQGLAKKCLGKDLKMQTDESQLVGDHGRVATLGRAQDILGWQPQVYVEEGLARLFEWVLEDMEHRGYIQPSMFGGDATAQSARSCLQQEANNLAKFKHSRVAASLVPEGRTVWTLGSQEAAPAAAAVADRAYEAADDDVPSSALAKAVVSVKNTAGTAVRTSLKEQLGGKLECKHEPLSEAPEEDAGTLVVIICSTRGRHLTWRHFNENVLIPLEADLALAVSRDTMAEAASDSFHQNAKYTWLVDEPPDNDYWYYFNEIAQECFGRTFSKEDAEKLGTEINGIWLGLIKASKQRTASSVLIFFRWLVLQFLEKNNLLPKYKYIVVTRSDYLYVHPHPAVQTLKQGWLMIPEGEGYGGFTDRHTVMQSVDAHKVLQLAEKVVFGSGKEVVKFWMKALGHIGANGVNLEQILKCWYEHWDFRVKSFKPAAFVVFDLEDSSVQRAGEHSLAEYDPYVVVRVHPKYYTEYNGVALGQPPEELTLYHKVTDEMFRIEAHRQWELQNPEAAKKMRQKQKDKDAKEGLPQLPVGHKLAGRKEKSSPRRRGTEQPAQPVPLAISGFSAASTPRRGSAMCFELPKEGMSKVHEFAPPVASRLTGPSSKAAAQDRVQQELAGRAADCTCTLKPFEMCPHGIGSTMASMLRPFTEAFIHGAPFDAVGPAPGKLSLSSIGLQPLVSECVAERSNPNGATCKNMVNPSCHFWHWRQMGTQVPPAYKEHGLFWWTAQQWAWLLRPDSSTTSKLSSLKNQLDWDSHRPILGMHVRHGDSCMEGEGKRTGRVCESLDVYMDGARRLQQYGYRSIFLTSDDPAIAERAKRDYPNITWLFGGATSAQARNSQGGGSHRFEQLAYESKEKNMDLVKEFQEVLLDIFMLADTDGFVGKFTSNIDRISYALNYGQRGCAMPFVSMDAYWCNDYAMPKGKTVAGATFAC